MSYIDIIIIDSALNKDMDLKNSRKE